MALAYSCLGDPGVRAHMVNEWQRELDVLTRNYSRAAWPYGRALNDHGLAVFLQFVPEALAHWDDEWLYSRIDDATFWQSQTSRTAASGKVYVARTNVHSAARTLAQGEFNTAYVRGLSAALLEQGVEACTVYRAGQAAEPRLTYCTALEGHQVPVQVIYDFHRANYFPSPGNPASRPIPSGPNCHHTIRP